MDEKDIAVTKTEQFATYRQIITPNGLTAAQIVTTLLEVYRANHITGTITINVNQGGVRNFIADQVAKVPPNTVADHALEALFGHQISETT